MNKTVYINLKEYADYSTHTISKGFIEFPEQLIPIAWNNRVQFMGSNYKLSRYVKLYQENNFNIAYRHTREDDWTYLKSNEMLVYDENSKQIIVVDTNNQSINEIIQNELAVEKRVTEELRLAQKKQECMSNLASILINDFSYFRKYLLRDACTEITQIVHNRYSYDLISCDKRELLQYDNKLLHMHLLQTRADNICSKTHENIQSTTLETMSDEALNVLALRCVELTSSASSAAEVYVELILEGSKKDIVSVLGYDCFA